MALGKLVVFLLINLTLGYSEQVSDFLTREV